jgi:hypothetical protein
VATLLALDHVWRQVDLPPEYRQRGDRPRTPGRRLVVVDEAWQLMRDGEGARFLFRMSKAVRKRNAGLTVVTQDAVAVLGTDLGQAVVSNAATQILLKQAPQAIDAVGDAFGLTAGERADAARRPHGHRSIDQRHAQDRVRGPSRRPPNTPSPRLLQSSLKVWRITEGTLVRTGAGLGKGRP